MASRCCSPVNVTSAIDELMPRYLVLGSGGREHAIAWKLSRERDADVVVAPGNDGIAATANCRVANVSLADHDALVKLARDEGVDLTVVGPEAPLCAGIADRFAEEGLLLFGPTAKGAMLEGSKAFAKDVMVAAGVPTAAYAVFESLDMAIEHVERAPHPVVIKADGLAGGKGVVISATSEESVATLRSFLSERRFGAASSRVVIEQHLSGPEVSFMVVTDGTTIVPLETSQDHKRVGDGDVGPNTGGMGAITPSPHRSDSLRDELVRTVIRPTLDELRGRGIDYRGFLYAGVMLTQDGPRVLEFNVRLGDPETQALLVAMDRDLGPILAAAARGRLEPGSLETRNAACCIVMAAEGYPGAVRDGDRIEGLDDVEDPGVVVFHAGTRRENGAFVTAGGRVLGVTARGTDVRDARARAYEAVARIDWRGKHYRRDIGGAA